MSPARDQIDAYVNPCHRNPITCLVSVTWLDVYTHTRGAIQGFTWYTCGLHHGSKARFWIAFVYTPLETSVKNCPCVTLKRAYLLSVRKVSSKSPRHHVYQLHYTELRCTTARCYNSIDLYLFTKEGGAGVSKRLLKDSPSSFSNILSDLAL